MTDLWGPILASDWRRTPHVSGRAATEADVIAGLAVFYVAGESLPVAMDLPCCAIQALDDGSKQSVVIVQSELGPNGTLLGVRPLSGGNGICMATDVQLLPDGFPS